MPLHEDRRFRRAPASKLSAFMASLLFTGLIVTSAKGYGFHDALNFGNGIDAVGIRSSALVGSTVFGAEGPVAVLLNPAGLSEVAGFQVSASGSIVAWTETVVDSTSKVNRAGTGFATATLAISQRIGPGLVLGAGTSKVMDNQYDGTHYLPDDPSQPDIDRVEILQSKGGLWEALGGISYRLSESASIGVSAGLRFGSTDYTYTFDESYTPHTDSTAAWSWEEQEFCYHAGLVLDDGFLSAGACFISGSEHYQPRASVAGRVRAEHIGNIRLGFEAQVVSPFEDNYFRGKLSLEMPVRDDFSILTGVGFYEGANMDRTGMAFSLGGDYRLGDMLFEAAMYYSGRARKSTSFPSEYSDRVEDDWTLFSVGISYGN